MFTVTKENVKGRAITELQGQAVNLLTGAAANTRFPMYRAGNIAKGLRSYDTLLIGIKHPAAAVPAALTLTNLSKEFNTPSEFSVTTDAVITLTKADHGLATDDYIRVKIKVDKAEYEATKSSASVFTSPITPVVTEAYKDNGTAIADFTQDHTTDGVLTVTHAAHGIESNDNLVYALDEVTVRVKVTVNGNDFAFTCPKAAITPARITMSAVKITEDTADCVAEVRWFSRDNL